MGKLTFHETPAPEYNMCNEKNPFSAVVRKRDIFLGLLFCKQELLFQKKLDELPTNVQYPNKNIYIDVFHELRETYFYDYKLQELEKNEKHFIKTSYDEDLTQYENTGIFIPLFYYFFKKIKLVEWIDENLSIHDAYLSLNKDKFFMNDKINSDFLDGALRTINNRIEHYKLVHDDIKGLREYELIERTKTTKIEQEPQYIAHLPEYIKKLIDSGYIKQDGKTTIKGLNDIAVFLAQCKIEVRKKLLEQFIMPNGKKYSDSAIAQAVNIASAL